MDSAMFQLGVFARLGTRIAFRVAALTAALALTSLSATAQAAQAPVGLGTADSFAVLAGSAVTNTGPSVVNGNLGLSPGTSITGFPPGTVNGTVHATNAVAGQAQIDLTTAYNDAAGRGPAVAMAAEIGGLVLAPGVFRTSSSMQLTGALTLDAQGDPNAVFIFQAGSTLTTASASRVNLINGANACNVFWQVGSSATLGTTTSFVGSILALTSISVNSGATIQGRALARNGAVTLINDTITATGCAGSSSGGTTAAPGDGSALLTTIPRRIARQIARNPGECVDEAFRASVTGLRIRRVVFSVGGRTIATRTRAPYTVSIRRYRGGSHLVRARVTFTDGTPAVTLRLRFRACAMPSAAPPRSPTGLTG